MSGNLAGLSWAFYAVLTLATMHLFWRVTTLDIDDAKGCLLRFKSNRHFSLIVFVAIIAGQLV